MTTTPLSTERNYWLMWVCTNCIMHHANGECGDCHREEGHDYEPLSELGEYDLTMGLHADEHDSDCIIYKLDELNREYPDMDWPDAPDDYECECHRNTFSRSQCDGCGDYHHGEREALTAWERPEPVTDENDPEFHWDINNLPKAAEWPYVEDAPEGETLARSYLRMGISPCSHCGKMTGH